jgi:hypothetical protein
LGTEAGETLYLAGDPGGVLNGPTQLAALDVQTFQTHPIAQVTPTISGCELTGTGSGQLYGFFRLGDTRGLGGAGTIGQIDKNTAQLLSATTLPSVDISHGWAFAFWGGDFYTFTASQVETVVQRFRPSDGTVVTVATSSLLIDGAGVSTCAPQM